MLVIIHYSSNFAEFYFRVIFQFGPSTPNYSNLGHCIPIWSLFRIPVFQLGSFWGRIFHFGPFSSTYIPMCPPVMELFQYGPHRCRLSVVAGVLGGTHCESVWSRFGMVMLRPFYVRYYCRTAVPYMYSTSYWSTTVWRYAATLR